MTARCSTVESGFTTKTNCPSWPVCTAWLGTTVAFGSVVRRSVTRANWPGHRRWSALSNVALSLIVSVVDVDGVVDEGERAVAGCASLSCGVAVTASLPRAMCCLIVERCDAGTAKVT